MKTKTSDEQKLSNMNLAEIKQLIDLLQQFKYLSYNKQRHEYDIQKVQRYAMETLDFT